MENAMSKTEKLREEFDELIKVELNNLFQEAIVNELGDIRRKIMLSPKTAEALKRLVELELEFNIQEAKNDLFRESVEKWIGWGIRWPNSSSTSLEISLKNLVKLLVENDLKQKIKIMEKRTDRWRIFKKC